MPRLAHLARALVFATLFLLVPAPQAAPPLPAEAASGLVWLRNQIQADGSLLSEPASSASLLQTRSEAFATLTELAESPATVLATLVADTDTSTEYLARRILALRRAGVVDVSAIASQLMAARNPDGGFGGAPGYQSNALDTAYALAALAVVGNSAQSGSALDYLRVAQAGDGGFGLAGVSDLYTSSVVLSALATHAAHEDLSQPIQRVIGFLQAHRSEPGIWSDSVGLNGLVYLALHDFIDQQPDADGFTAFLRERQAAPGSWEDGDPYVTALALRAWLRAGTKPANPLRGIVRGRIVDGQVRVGFAGGDRDFERWTVAFSDQPELRWRSFRVPGPTARTLYLGNRPDELFGSGNHDFHRRRADGRPG